MISGERRANNANRAITNGLIALHIPVPLTTVQWADKYYYLPKESSYTPGKWETLPFQVAIMNAMGYELIRVVNLIKSARVGYTKMLLGVEGYFIEHKSRNSLLFQPTDSSAEDFMKSHVEPTIRDVPVLLELAPWFGRKHRDNTLTLKRFSSGVGFWCLGGAAAKNYREKSVDVVCYDELSSFEPDVEKEGSPTLLGDKRIEGSVWPKSIRGSTPKVKGSCQIEKAANESAHFMRFHVPCPHCGEEQYLKFGDGSTSFGLKWEKSKPETVYYLCEHNGCVIRQSELDQKAGRWICDNTGMWTRDGLAYFSASGEEVPPPRSITFHIWTAYSPFTTWISSDSVARQMRLAWDSFINCATEINWQYASARQNAVFSTTAYCPSKTLCPNARTEYIGFGDYRTYCKKSGNCCISTRHQVDDIYIGAHTHTIDIGAHNHAIHTGAYAYLHAVSPGIHSHGYHLNPEYLSGVKNDV